MPQISVVDAVILEMSAVSQRYSAHDLACPQALANIYATSSSGILLAIRSLVGGPAQNTSA
jgi:hypothetical protein